MLCRKVFFLLVAALAVRQACCDEKFEKIRVELLDSSGVRHEISAELADTDGRRMQGFMFRKKVPDGTGMLFVYERDARLSFWMKNTLVPLSIAFIDSSGRIREIFDMKAGSERPVKSSTSVRFALEVPQGYFGKIGISAGDFMVLPAIGVKK